MFFDFKRYDLNKVGRYKLNKRLRGKPAKYSREPSFPPRRLGGDRRRDHRLANSHGEADDIDHLANRRLKMVGEQIQEAVSALD